MTSLERYWQGLGKLNSAAFISSDVASTQGYEVTIKALHTAFSTSAHLFSWHIKNKTASFNFDRFTDGANQPGVRESQKEGWCHEQSHLYKDYTSSSQEQTTYTGMSPSVMAASKRIILCDALVGSGRLSGCYCGVELLMWVLLSHSLSLRSA